MITTTRDPNVWGQDAEGFVTNGIVFRRGIVTTHRQVFKLFSDGYQVVAEGTSQTTEFFQTNFPCSQGSVDNFKYHLDCAVHDEIANPVIDGPHWADPDDAAQDGEWSDIDSGGNFIAGTGTGAGEPLFFIDVWTND